MAKKISTTAMNGPGMTPTKLVLTDVPDDWRSLVEQIAELEDILLECGAIHDREAMPARIWLQSLLMDKRRHLRRIDVAVSSTTR